MASFRKRAGRWQARVNQAGASPLVKTFDTKSDAERWARAIQRDIDLGTYLSRNDAETTTVSQVIERYSLEVVPNFKGAEREKYTLRNLNAFLGTYKLASLTPLVVAKYRDKRMEKVCGGTVLREVNSLSAMLNHARKEWGIGLTNPVAAIRKPVPNKGRTRRLEAEEESRLMLALEPKGRCPNGQLMGGARNHWVKPIVLFAIETAMRRGEILALEWEHIDLDRRVAHLPITKNGLSRDVPLSTQAIQILRNIPRAIQGRVFPITAEALKRVFIRACASANIKDLHFHDLRHEATSRMAHLLPNVIELASVTGHQDLKMLQRYYHTRPEELALKLG